MKRSARTGILFLLTLLIATEVSSQKYTKDSIPGPIGYTNDFENIFSKKQERYLDSMMRAFEKKTTVQIALITIDTSMVNKADFQDYVFKISNKWGVGQKESNNGVTIGVSRGYRFMRIDIGYGIEKILTDSETKKIIDSFFIPSFRKGLYFEGVIEGLKAIMKKLR
jgi:uncharacterized protein